MMINTILFDMDGVAADWRSFTQTYIWEQHGVSLDEKGFDWLNKHPELKAKYDALILGQE
ncbi:MAG: hypothetical protein WCY93_10485 [Anaerolineaceae bacterium]